MRTSILKAIMLLGVPLSGSAQVSQQANSATTGTLQPTSASSAAKAEFWRALDDWQNFGWVNAQERFERALTLDSAFGLARVFMVEAAVMRGFPLQTAELDRGIADAARASTAEGLIALAWREKAAGNDRSAATLLHTAMELLPNEPHLVSEYVWSLSAVDMQAALDSARAARTRFPSFGPLSPALTFVLTQTGDTAAALAEARHYTELAPTQPASFAYYGRLLQMAGRMTEAEAQFRQSIASSTVHAVAPYDGAMALAEVRVLQGDVASARDVLHGAMRRSTSTSDSIRYLQALAGTQLLLGDQSGAIRSYEGITPLWLALRPPAGLDIGPLGVALVNAAFGDRRLVSKSLADVHIIVPTDSVWYEMSVANVYAYAAQTDSTFKYADKLAARAPATPFAGQVAHFVRGELYLQTRRCDKAVVEFVQSDTTTVEIQQGMAECELQLGHRDAARVWRNRALMRRDVNLLDPGELHARMRVAQLR